MSKRTTDEILLEVLEKLNVVMSYTYINEENTLMDVYQDLKGQQKLMDEEVPVVTSPEKAIEIDDALLEQIVKHAYETGSFKIDEAKKEMVVEYFTAIYHIPLAQMERINDRSKG